MLSPFTLCHSPGSPTGCSASRGSALYGPARRAQAACRDLLAEAVAVAVRRQVLEAGVLADEGHVHRADGAITLLADDQLGQALVRSEEHTSELQSRPHLVCRLLLE